MTEVTVYVDILLILNAFVNFFILLLTSAVSKKELKLLRIILASIVGSLFSLYIFLPSRGFLIETLVRFACSVITVFVCFGKMKITTFIRLTLTFYAASFIYAGVMLAIWFILKPEAMAINNGMVYLGISPLLLIGITLASYIILSLIKFFTRKNGEGGGICGLKCEFGGKTIILTALIDTGHSIRDQIGNLPIAVITPAKIKELLQDDFESFCSGEIDADSPLFSKIRMIPCKTVGGSILLKALRCEKATVHIKDKVLNKGSILLAMSETNLGGDYDAIVGTDITE